jgi:release factor glutamine methyltransferase
MPKEIGLVRDWLLEGLSGYYDKPESEEIVSRILEKIAGVGKMEIILYPERTLTDDVLASLAESLKQLQSGRPVQYVTGTAYFYGLELMVDEQVLIPRPETEELVKWVIDDLGHIEGLKVLDIGTGSGCIAISLARHFKNAAITAIDNSRAALSVAERNATSLGVPVTFREADVFFPSSWKGLGTFDLLISNPPYVTATDRKKMSRNVTGFEPAGALYVPDDDPLLYHAATLRMADRILIHEGMVYMEINERFGDAILGLAWQYGYADATLRKDIRGKDRMVRLKKC